MPAPTGEPTAAPSPAPTAPPLAVPMTCAVNSKFQPEHFYACRGICSTLDHKQDHNCEPSQIHHGSKICLNGETFVVGESKPSPYKSGKCACRQFSLANGTQFAPEHYTRKDLFTVSACDGSDAVTVAPTEAPATPPPGGPTCKCVTPGKGVGPEDSAYTCTDGSKASCPAGEACVATAEFQQQGGVEGACEPPAAGNMTCAIGSNFNPRAFSAYRGCDTSVMTPGQKICVNGMTFTVGSSVGGPFEKMCHCSRVTLAGGEAFPADHYKHGTLFTVGAC